MLQNLLRLGIAVVLVSLVWSSEFLSDIEALDSRDSTPGQTCHGQSCTIAALSGSSGRPYKAANFPHDGTPRGYCCILRYNSQPRKLLYQQKPSLRGKCQQTHFNQAVNATEDVLGSAAACKSKALIFAKGTSETGPLGNSVGPALQSGLEGAEPGVWSFHGVHFRNDETGNHCVGLPGGAHAADLLEQVASNCPDTQIIMSGYSQGAMVSRNGIAYSRGSSHKNLKAIVTFGDPFNGAPIRKFNGRIIVYCHKHDRVCDGRNIIHNAHLTYVGADTDSAVQKMIAITS